MYIFSGFSGLTAQLAEFFIKNCPKLEELRDVASWTGTEEAWRSVAAHAEKAGLTTGWAKKTNRSALYTIDYDAEGWYQVRNKRFLVASNKINFDFIFRVVCFNFIQSLEL